MNVELIYTLILAATTAVVALAYWVRIRVKGHAHFDRIDRQGGSVLLSKEVMEGGYWFLQPFAKLLVFCHVTPNQISWTALFLGLVAGLCLAFGHFGSGAVFAALSALMDALDGIVARLTGASSDAGEVLDTAVDRYAEFFFLGGLTIYYREIPFLMVLCLLALAGSFMVSYSSAKAEALQVSPPKGSMRRPERAIYLILGATLSPVTIPWFETVREFPVPIGHPMVLAVGLVAVLANVSAVERLWITARMMRAREAEAIRVASVQAAAVQKDEHAAAEESTVS